MLKPLSMAQVSTKFFGSLQYGPEAEFHFPYGIPGFEHHRRYLFVEQPQTHPLVFVQSLEDSGVCFLAVPAHAIAPDFRLELSPEDKQALQIKPGEPCRVGEDLLCLALVTLTEGADPTANLRAPLVASLRTKRGLQSIQPESVYSFRHPIISSEGIAVCS